jgi:hypothetical protein
MLNGLSISTRRTVPKPASAHRRRAVCSLNPQVPSPAPSSASEVVRQNSRLPQDLHRIGGVVDHVEGGDEADPSNRAEVYRRLRLRLAYHPPETGSGLIRRSSSNREISGPESGSCPGPSPT